MKTRRTRIIIDAIMTVLLPVLMAYSLVGETLHELAGTLMFILFIAHHVINRKATAAMFKGRQTPGRIIRTVVNILLFVFMIAQPISGILMSKHLYTFLPIDGLAYLCRVIHLPLAYWGFVLMSMHLGMHLESIIPKLRAQKRKCTVLLTVGGLISAYGIYAFVKRNFCGYLFLKTQFAFFDFDEPRIFFFLDHLAVLVLFAFIGYLLYSVPTGRGGSGKEKP